MNYYEALSSVDFDNIEIYGKSRITGERVCLSFEDIRGIQFESKLDYDGCEHHIGISCGNIKNPKVTTFPCIHMRTDLSKEEVQLLEQEVLKNDCILQPLQEEKSTEQFHEITW